VQKACAQSPRKATAAAAKTGNRAAAKTGRGTVSMPAVGQAFRSRRAPVAALKSKFDVQSGESLKLKVDCTADKYSVEIARLCSTSYATLVLSTWDTPDGNKPVLFCMLQHLFHQRWQEHFQGLFHVIKPQEVALLCTPAGEAVEDA
jgi:hypothetical protein